MFPVFSMQTYFFLQNTSEYEYTGKKDGSDSRIYENFEPWDISIMMWLRTSHGQPIIELRFCLLHDRCCKTKENMLSLKKIILSRLTYLVRQMLNK